MALSRNALLAALFIAFTVPGCSGILGPDSIRELAEIPDRDGEVVDQIPDTVRAGEIFAVSFTTHHGGCATADETVVRVDGLRADVLPYVRVRVTTGDTVCPGSLAIIERTVEISFPAPGDARVVIHGRRRVDGGGFADVAVPFDVVVTSAPAARAERPFRPRG